MSYEQLKILNQCTMNQTQLTNSVCMIYQCRQTLKQGVISRCRLVQSTTKVLSIKQASKITKALFNKLQRLNTEAIICKQVCLDLMHREKNFLAKLILKLQLKNSFLNRNKCKLKDWLMWQKMIGLNRPCIKKRWKMKLI